MRLVLTALLALMLPFAANAQEKEIQRADNAVRVLSEILAIPEESIPERLLREAEAIAVMPDVVKAGLIFGGRGGKGLMAVRGSDGTWSNPTFITLGGGSFGFQAGVQSADVVLVFRSERGLDSIVNGKFTLGADAGVAAGPMGRNAAAATDGRMKAEIWSWSRARGLFAGVALDGAVLSIDDKSNEAVYGRDTTPRMIFEDRAPQGASDAVAKFRDLLAQASTGARQRRADDPAPVATSPIMPVAPADAAPAPMPASDAAPAQPQPFETVDAPAKAEPLP